MNPNSQIGCGRTLARGPCDDPSYNKTSFLIFQHIELRKPRALAADRSARAVREASVPPLSRLLRSEDRSHCLRQVEACRRGASDGYASDASSASSDSFQWVRSDEKQEARVRKPASRRWPWLGSNRYRAARRSSPAARLIGTPRKRTNTAGEVSDG